MLFAVPFERYAKVGLLEVTDTAVRLAERGWDVADALAGELLREAGE